MDSWWCWVHYTCTLTRYPDGFRDSWGRRYVCHVRNFLLACYHRATTRKTRTLCSTQTPSLPRRKRIHTLLPCIEVCAKRKRKKKCSSKDKRGECCRCSSFLRFPADRVVAWRLWCINRPKLKAFRFERSTCRIRRPEDLVSRYEVRSLPALVFLCRGVVVDRVEGANEERIRAAFDMLSTQSDLPFDPSASIDIFAGQTGSTKHSARRRQR